MVLLLRAIHVLVYRLGHLLHLDVILCLVLHFCVLGGQSRDSLVPKEVLLIAVLVKIFVA